jgi:hypothetical protein
VRKKYQKKNKKNTVHQASRAESRLLVAAPAASPARCYRAAPCAAGGEGPRSAPCRDWRTAVSSVLSVERRLAARGPSLIAVGPRPLPSPALHGPQQHRHSVRHQVIRLVSRMNRIHSPDGAGLLSPPADRRLQNFDQFVARCEEEVPKMFCCLLQVAAELLLEGPQPGVRLLKM